MNRQTTFNYPEKLTELRLLATPQKDTTKVFVLLEGETDIKLFKKLFHPDNCNLHAIPGGKTKVIDGVDVLLSKTKLVLGIVDADFDHITPKDNIGQHIFMTDYHDMEMMLLAEGEVFHALMHEYANGLHQRSFQEVWDTVAATILELCLLKLLNINEELKLKVDVGMDGLVNFKSKHFDIEGYFSRAISKSEHASVRDFSEIKEKIEALKKANYDFHQLCNGKDFIKAMCTYLSKTYIISIDEKYIKSSCRMTYNLGHYKKTKLYNDTQLWATKMSCVIY